MVYNEWGITVDTLVAGLKLYRMGNLRVLAATGTRSDSKGLVTVLSTSDVPWAFLQFPAFAYNSGSYYCAEGRLIGKNGTDGAGTGAGNLGLGRFTPGGTSPSDANIYYYFTIAYVID